MTVGSGGSVIREGRWYAPGGPGLEVSVVLVVVLVVVGVVVVVVVVVEDVVEAGAPPWLPVAS